MYLLGIAVFRITEFKGLYRNYEPIIFIKPYKYPIKVNSGHVVTSILFSISELYEMNDD